MGALKGAWIVTLGDLLSPFAALAGDDNLSSFNSLQPKAGKRRGDLKPNQVLCIVMRCLVNLDSAESLSKKGILQTQSSTWTVYLTSPQLHTGRVRFLLGSPQLSL